MKWQRRVFYFWVLVNQFAQITFKHYRWFAFFEVGNHIVNKSFFRFKLLKYFTFISHTMSLFLFLMISSNSWITFAASSLLSVQLFAISSISVFSFYLPFAIVFELIRDFIYIYFLSLKLHLSLLNSASKANITQKRLV